MTHLTAIVLTYNEAEHIRDCLKTLNFADSVIVHDSFSDDGTVEMAEAAGAKVIQRAFDNYAGQRNAALEAVKGTTDWIFFVDADERVTPSLAAEVREVIENHEYVGWRVPRDNYLFGKLTRWAGWYPDYQTRLLKSGWAHYDPERLVHELVILNGAEGTLKESLIHYNYKDAAQFRAKQRKYATLDAQIMYEQRIRPKPQNYILQPLRQFWWRYMTLNGYRDGFHGLRLSALMGWYELRKYLLLRGLWKNKTGEPVPAR